MQFLFYNKPSPEQGKQRMMAVTVESSAAFKHEPPRVLFDAAPFSVSTPIRGYDISPDGQHFIFFRRLVEPPKMITEIKIISNWFEVLRRRVPARN